MKKLGLLFVIGILLFGCRSEQVEDIDGVFVCGKEMKTIMNDTIEFLTYGENVITVSDGYIDTIVDKYYMSYDNIVTYYDMTVEEYYQRELDNYSNSVSEPGFDLLAPEDTSKEIVTIHLTDYRDLSIMDVNYLPQKALNEDKTKIIYQKYMDEYLSNYSCKLIE